MVVCDSFPSHPDCGPIKNNGTKAAYSETDSDNDNISNPPNPFASLDSLIKEWAANEKKLAVLKGCFRQIATRQEEIRLSGTTVSELPEPERVTDEPDEPYEPDKSSIFEKVAMIKAIVHISDFALLLHRSDGDIDPATLCTVDLTNEIMALLYDGVPLSSIMGYIKDQLNPANEST